jgi:hypothetical protein
VVVDKDEVKKALKSGSHIPGAALSEGKVYLVRR